MLQNRTTAKSFVVLFVLRIPSTDFYLEFLDNSNQEVKSVVYKMWKMIKREWVSHACLIFPLFTAKRKLVNSFIRTLIKLLEYCLACGYSILYGDN